MGPIGWPELLIILVVVLLLFGTTRLAGLGKASGKAIREFKEETQDLKKKDAQAEVAPEASTPAQPVQPVQPAPQDALPRYRAVHCAPEQFHAGGPRSDGGWFRFRTVQRRGAP